MSLFFTYFQFIIKPYLSGISMRISLLTQAFESSFNIPCIVQAGSKYSRWAFCLTVFCISHELCRSVRQLQPVVNIQSVLRTLDLPAFVGTSTKKSYEIYRTQNNKSFKVRFVHKRVIRFAIRHEHFQKCIKLYWGRDKNNVVKDLLTSHTLLFQT